MSKNSLYVHVVLDSSGSMLLGKSITLKALNDYIRALDDDTVITVDRFAYSPHRLRTACPKQEAIILANEYPCEGGTALYDAIGHAIAAVDQHAVGFDRVALVIQTDGQERDSKEFKLDTICQLLRDKEEGEGWLIVYLGAGLQAAEQLAALGGNHHNTAMYSPAVSGQAFSAAANSTLRYSTATTRTMGRTASAFTDQERKSMK